MSFWLGFYGDFTWGQDLEISDKGVFKPSSKKIYFTKLLNKRDRHLVTSFELIYPKNIYGRDKSIS